MNDAVRKSLTELIRDEGRKIVGDHDRVVSHLRSSCPNDSWEIDDLSRSLELGIPDRLLNVPENQLPEQISQLADELAGTGSFDQARADWVVETWAVALRFITTETVLRSDESLNAAPAEQKPTATHPSSSPVPPKGSKGTCLGCLFKFVYGMFLLLVVAIMLIPWGQKTEKSI